MDELKAPLAMPAERSHQRDSEGLELWNFELWRKVKAAMQLF